MQFMMDINDAFEQSEKRTNEKFNIGCSNLIVEINECLGRIIQTAIYNAEHSEKSFREDVVEIKEKVLKNIKNTKLVKS